MCGLFGVIDSSNVIDVRKARKALDLQVHRGPDGFGEWVAEWGYMGHRRLSILDLGDNGRQPMESAHCVIAVNGEIYNYKALREELSAEVCFHSGSDSEVVLHGYSAWGIDGLLARLEGMYALSIYDKRSKRVYLARDRVGIKPIYYFEHEGELVWASELKSIVQYKNLSESDYLLESLYDFTTYRYIPPPKTLYKNVYKLPPASFVTFDLSSKCLCVNSYWDVEIQRVSVGDSDAIRQLESLLTQSIREQLISDVPVGALLSGGIDSGSLVALSRGLGKDLETFSIGFNEPDYDESLLIKQVSQHLGVVNHLEYLSLSDIAEWFRASKDWFDEPFADFSMLPTYAVCKYARNKVTVALSGDGADELFAGYPRYLHAQLLTASNKKLSRILGELKATNGWSFLGRLSRLLESRTLSGWDWYCAATGGILPNESVKLRQQLELPKDYDAYWFFRKHWREDLSPVNAIRYLEFKTSLPEAMLTKVDRVSMQNSLEVRVPYLSTEIVNFAFSIDPELLMRRGKPKYLLRSMADSYLPKTVTAAPKRGFGLPPELRLDIAGRRCSAQHKVISEIFEFENLSHYIV